MSMRTWIKFDFCCTCTPKKPGKCKDTKEDVHFDARSPGAISTRSQNDKKVKQFRKHVVVVVMLTAAFNVLMGGTRDELCSFQPIWIENTFWVESISIVQDKLMVSHSVTHVAKKFFRSDYRRGRQKEKKNLFVFFSLVFAKWFRFDANNQSASETIVRLTIQLI